MPWHPPDSAERLAPWAAVEASSRGRQHVEEAHAYRGEFQRDRDRIVHSSAFRRLVYKTQVFVNHEGDHYRTRLTHSLEVAQIGRTVSACLGLNEQLVEAICLAHDLGHTPFGHAGQDALNECMQDCGGFEHNLQSLRVVDELEDKYADFPGLNLTFETREGILKHCSKRNARELGELGERFLNRGQPSLEAQLANIADEIAYNNHDVDDGLRAGLLTEAELDDVDLFEDQHRAVKAASPSISRRALIHEIVRGMINEVVTDLIDTSRAALDKHEPANIETVRQASQPMIRLSRPVLARHKALKKFLNQSLYRHERVLEMSGRAAEVVRGLFGVYMNDLNAMPAPHARRAEHATIEQGDHGRARAVADYVAGMTDRYALAAFGRLIGRAPEIEMQTTNERETDAA